MDTSNDKISRRSFIKSFFLGGFGMFVALFNFKSKSDKKKSINSQ